MTLIKLIKDYISENSVAFYSYIFICCVGYFVRVIVTSLIYGQFFEANVGKDDFLRVIKNICLVWVVLSVLYIIQLRLEYKVIPDFIAYIRKKIFKNYILMNETNFNDSNITDDVNNILEMTRNLRDIFLWGCQTLIPTIFIMIVINGYFLFRYPIIGIVNVFGNIINMFISLSSYKDLIEVANIRMEKYIVMANKLDESFNNMFNAYLNDKIDDTVKENNQIEQDYYDSFIDQMKNLEMFATKIRVNNYFFAFISLYFLYKKYSKADFINALLIYTFYISCIETMADDIPFIVITIGNISRSSKKLFTKDENNKYALSVRPTYPIYLENYQGNIKFENVWFKYNAEPTHVNSFEDELEDQVDIERKTGKYVLKEFNLDIPAKSRIAIVARSGSGKSTLMKLLLDFYTPEKGRILLDNKDIKEIDPVSIRRNINYINQRTLLIKDTIMNNIKYGNNKSDKEVIDTLIKYDLLKVFNPPTLNPESCLQNMVEKNGINISMGMQKVIFLVRGSLRDGVVFVFDEPLTSVDSKTRVGVLQMIADKTQGKTLIIITHDMEVERIVDRVINIDDINQKDL
jgi:ABC-type multidrug transport system fused ATPase/permease subunit